VLMLRAGLVAQVMAGAYTYLPLGLRSLKKAERMVREEMDAAGAIELAMPSLSPLALWEQSGRVEAFGDVLMQLSVRRQSRKVPMVLGPTHEEIITDMIARQISSYRQMPIHALPDHHEVPQRGAAAVRRAADQRIPHEGRLQLRQLGGSARAQLRRDVQGLLPDLQPLRAGLPGVEAESGPIGGDASHEFMVPAETAKTPWSTAGSAATRRTWNGRRWARWAGPRPRSRSNLQTVPTPGAATHRPGQQVPRLPCPGPDQDAHLRG